MGEKLEFARKATQHDVTALEALLSKSLREVSQNRGGEAFLREFSDEPRSVVSTWSANEATDLIVGGVEDSVLGFAAITWPEDDLCKISWLYVARPARGIGIGSAIMNTAIEAASAKDCSRIDSIAFPGDAKTKNFFESYGLKARLLTVARSLEL